MKYKHDISLQPVTNLDSVPFTWERLIPKQIPGDRASKAIFDIHMRRYEIAARYVQGKRVLDIACGTGYGSQMLSLAGAIAVVGVDICPHTIEYARKNYHENNVEFICADALSFEWREQFDVIISFETIEHVPHPAKFLERLRHLMTPGGDLLLSVPIGETRHIDRYHLHAFSQQDIFTLLENASFSVDEYHYDHWCLTRADLLLWRKLYPAARPTLREQLFTFRGWQLIRDFVFTGVINLSEIMVTGKLISSEVPEDERLIKMIDCSSAVGEN